MFFSVTEGRVYFAEPAWSQIAPSAQDLVRSLLKADPAQRPSAVDVQRHVWLKEGLQSSRNLELSLAYLHHYQAQQMRHVAFKVLASSLTEAEVADVRCLFEWVDVDSKGYLSHQDVEDGLAHEAYAPAGLRASGSRAPPPDVDLDRYSLPLVLRTLQRTALTTQSVVTFETFLNAVLEQDDDLIRRNLLNVFQTLDPDCTGYVAATAAVALLCEFGLEADGKDEAGAMLQAAADGAGRLSYDRFLDVLLREHRQQAVAAVVVEAAAVPLLSHGDRGSSMGSRCGSSMGSRGGSSMGSRCGSSCGPPPADTATTAEAAATTAEAAATAAEAAATPEPAPVVRPSLGPPMLSRLVVSGESSRSEPRCTSLGQLPGRETSGRETTGRDTTPTRAKRMSRRSDASAFAEMSQHSTLSEVSYESRSSPATRTPWRWSLRASDLDANQIAQCLSSSPSRSGVALPSGASIASIRSHRPTIQETSEAGMVDHSHQTGHEPAAAAASSSPAPGPPGS